MITILLKNHNFGYELENLTRLFFPNEKIALESICDEAAPVEPFIYTERISDKHAHKLRVRVALLGQEMCDEAYVPADFDEFDRECERVLAVMLFKMLEKITGLTPPWGVLTGVRPIKLLRRFAAQKGHDGAISHFKEKFLVSPAKIDLSIKTMREEQKVLDLSGEKSFSLYVSIPFCPTRCSYCSFVSQSVKHAARLIPDYVRLLCEELSETAKIVHKLGLRLETVYIGGGTPTTLSATQLERVLSTILRSFDMATCREFTVEAGRPDTITKEKLKVIKSAGASRISINPQTMNDDVLRAIGRAHSAKQTLEAFALARNLGFDNINMDTIAGLPTDTFESFSETIDKICALSPEGVTVHTLSIKTASNLTEAGKKIHAKEAATTARMLEFAEKTLDKNFYFPYYLYRQSKMLGNLENVGWAKKDMQGFYNVYVMDETHTILACGAGAVSKLKDPKSDYLKRIFNFKFPYEYISRFEEMITRKKQVEIFYDEFQQLV